MIIGKQLLLFLRAQRFNEGEVSIVNGGRFNQPKSLILVRARVYTIAGLYIPAEGFDVCGDVLAIYQPAEDACWVVVIDGVGKGSTALAIAEKCLQLLESCTYFHSTAEAVGHLDKLLSSALCEEYQVQYPSICLLSLDDEGLIRFVNAGAPPLFLLHRNKKVEAICGSDPPIGMGLNVKFTEKEVRLSEGESLIVTSDGVTGTKLPLGILEVEQVRSIIEANAKRRPEKTLLSVTERVVQLTQGKFYDDATIVVINRR